MTIPLHKHVNIPEYSAAKAAKTGQIKATNVEVADFSEQETVAFDFRNLPIYRPLIQPKLAINEPGDQYEQEADAVAEKVMRMEDLGGIYKKGMPSKLQRKCAHCEEEEKVQRKETTPSSFGEGWVEANAHSKKESWGGVNNLSDGKPLTHLEKNFFESRMGYDFSKVRIYDDAKANQSAKAINALAYTHGNNIVFGSNQYDPHAYNGKKLLAHELTHVIQQTGVIQRKPVETTIDTDTKIEEETSQVSQIDPDDEAVVAQFAVVNKTLNKVNLKKWVKESIEKGWAPGKPVPDYKTPDISFNEKEEPVIEAVDFRGTNGAFNTAAKLLPKDVGAKFWWKERFTNKPPGQYKLDYASNKAYKNLLLHEKAKDVDFDAILKVSDDMADYREIKAIKAYSDQLLSEAFVRFVSRAQAKLYPQDIEKQTGILDNQTAKDITAKIAADKKAEEDKKTAEAAAAKEAEQKKEEEAKPIIHSGPIHDTIRARIAKLREAIAAPVPYLIKAAEMASDNVSSLPIPNIPVEFLYRISQHLLVGFLTHIDTLPEEEIRTKFMHLVTVQYTPGYMWGQLKGIPSGIWSWIKDMAELIWDLVKLPYTISKFAFVTLPAELGGLYDKAEKAMEWFDDNKEVVFKFATDMLTGSGEELKGITDAVKDQVYSMAEGMGASAASSLSDLAGKSNEEIGLAIGKIQGYLLPDIILAIFSEGIGNAIKGGIQSIKIFIEAGRAGVITLKALEAGKAGVAAIEKFLEGAKIFAKEGYGKIKTILKDIIAYFKKILGIEEKALTEAKVTADLLEEAKTFSKLEKEAGEAAKKDAKKYSDGTVEDGPDKKSKSKILWKAIVIAEVADTQNLPITAAIAELDLLKVLNPKVTFEYTGNDPYEIWMRGSRYLVDPFYTAKGGGLKRTRTLASNKRNEMATAKGKSDLELGGKADASPENLRALKNERSIADAMAKEGFEVEFTEGKLTEAERSLEGLRATANPDLRVEGKLMDIYSPSRNSNPVTAVEHTFDKVRDASGAQTRRVIVSLDDAQIRHEQFRSALKQYLGKFGDSGMQEIFVVQKGRVYRMYP